MRSRPRPWSPPGAESLSDSEAGGVALGLLDAAGPLPRAPVTDPPGSGGRRQVRTAPSAPPPRALPLDAAGHCSLGQRTPPPLASAPPPPLDHLVSSPSSSSRPCPSRLPQSPDRRPARELWPPASRSSAQLQLPHRSLPSETNPDASSPHPDTPAASSSSKRQSRAAPSTPPQRTAPSPAATPASASDINDIDGHARRTLGRPPTTPGSPSRAAFFGASTPDTEAPWSTSTVRPGRSSERAASPIPTRFRSRRYTIDTEDESDGGIAFDSDMEQEFRTFAEMGRPPTWSLSTAVEDEEEEDEEEEDDELLEAFPETRPEETLSNTPTASQLVGQPLQPVSPSPTDYGGFTPHYFPSMYETVNVSSPLSETYDSDGDLSMDEPYMIDVTNIDSDLTALEQDDPPEAETDDSRYGGDGVAEERPEQNGDPAHDDGPEDQSSPSPGTPEDAEDPPADGEGVPTGGAIQVVMDPNTNMITYASVISPANNNGDAQEVSPTPFTTVTHVAHPMNLFLSAVLDSGFTPVVDGHFPNPFAPAVNNNVLFNPTLAYQETEVYNYDFERLFRALHNETYSSPHRCGTARRRTPRVAPKALFVTEWSKHREEEYPALQQDTKADIQGIDWDMLGITPKEARKYRRDTYRNYRNVKSFKRVPLNPIHNNSHFFRFLRHSTKTACRLLHFQLRNILTCTSRNDIFYSTGSWVVAYHPYTRSLKPVMNLTDDSFGLAEQVRISSLAAHHSPSHSLLLAGGFSGNYALRNLAAPLSDPMTMGVITDNENGITNHIHLTPSRTSSAPVAVFSSNDKHVRTLDTATASFTAQHSFPWAVNCAATSPDSRLRAVVGDSTDVVIVAAETGSVEMELKGQHQDFGFAVDWAVDGVTVATGNQDQTVRLFDVRNFTKPTRIIPMLMAGCRNLAFSPVPSSSTESRTPPSLKHKARTTAASSVPYDIYEPPTTTSSRGETWARQILAVAEPSDYIHFLDCNNWEKEAQTVEFWGEVAGMSWTPDAQQFVVANCDKSVGGVMVWERTLEGWGLGGAKVRRRKRRWADEDREDEVEEEEEQEEAGEEGERGEKAKDRREEERGEMGEMEGVGMGWKRRRRRWKRPLLRGSEVAYV